MEPETNPNEALKIDPKAPPNLEMFQSVARALYSHEDTPPPVKAITVCSILALIRDEYGRKTADNTIRGIGITELFDVLPEFKKDKVETEKD